MNAFDDDALAIKESSKFHRLDVSDICRFKD